MVDNTIFSKEVAKISGNTIGDGTGNEVRILVDAAGRLQIDVVSAITDVGDALESVGLDLLGTTMYGWDSVAPGWSVLEVNADGEIYTQITDGTNVISSLYQQNTYWNPIHWHLAVFTAIRHSTGLARPLPVTIPADSNINKFLWAVPTFPGFYNGTNFEVGVTDPIISGAILTTNIEHYEAHLGQMFIFSDVRIIPAANNLDYHIRDVGGATTDEMHANIIIRVDAAVEITIYENPTLSNDGTLLTAHNKNRNTGGAPGTTFYHTPTVTNVGTEIYNGAIMSATSPPHAAGGKVKGTNEWVFDSGDAYLIRIAGAQNDNVSIEIEFYEDV